MTVELPKLSQDEFILRSLVASGHGSLGMYRDDGELQDCFEQPFIDFMRDSPSEILLKINERALKKLARTPENENWIEP